MDIYKVVEHAMLTRHNQIARVGGIVVETVEGRQDALGGFRICDPASFFRSAEGSQAKARAGNAGDAWG